MEKVCKRETRRTRVRQKLFFAAHEYEMSAVQEREAESKPFFNTSQRRSPEYLMNERKVRGWGEEGLRKAISSASPSLSSFHGNILCFWPITLPIYPLEVV